MLYLNIICLFSTFDLLYGYNFMIEHPEKPIKIESYQQSEALRLLMHENFLQDLLKGPTKCQPANQNLFENSTKFPIEGLIYNANMGKMKTLINSWLNQEMIDQREYQVLTSVFENDQPKAMTKYHLLPTMNKIRRLSIKFLSSKTSMDKNATLAFSIVEFNLKNGVTMSRVDDEILAADEEQTEQMILYMECVSKRNFVQKIGPYIRNLLEKQKRYEIHLPLDIHNE